MVRRQASGSSGEGSPHRQVARGSRMRPVCTHNEFRYPLHHAFTLRRRHRLRAIEQQAVR
jgi:hypothetical protein